ncbi:MULTISPECIES: CPBP family intramembrane glutamic endopeptidase [Methanobacterium]|uniref:CPBP family intramembrane metalloprotease n=1 Tax=Methanobacterium veterum TaxID=408577 RepID=A0A9E4ZZ24_9EURY|nr:MULTISPECIES: CPBP family intramembrane glutamic endopeptidase [Methanobacterium]MCZ3364985.1 CPBP family intramembrane metalloprotease [Methanobacterium veterum]MCZ3372740.1 CPBP family intramembrane metalloprotease [Methanobacterium veterum]
METLKKSQEYKHFIKLLCKVIIILIIIQLLRAFVMDSLWYVIKPGENIVLFQILNGISFLIVGILLLVLFKPSLNDLSLNLDDVRKRTKIIYFAGMIALPVFIVLPVVLGAELDIIMLSFIFGLIVPAFEELLFRGYLWNNMQNSLKGKHSRLITWITITILFGLWHIGYIDVFLIHPKEFALVPLLIGKIEVGLILGAVVGFIRLKTNKVYGSFLFHGFWNIFAP